MEDKIGEYLKEKLSGNNQSERNLLNEGFEIGNAFALVDTLNYLNKYPNITLDEFKSDLIGTIEVTKYASELME